MTTGENQLKVVFGAGPVGRAVLERLLEQGRPVRVATRSGRAQVPAGVEVIAADLSKPDDAVTACRGAGVVYVCVGLDYTGWPERWPRLMSGMLAGAEASGARLIFMDDLYMYGPVDEPLREDMPLTEYGKKPATRAHITRMWQEAHQAGRVQAAAVRASDFYGPGVLVSMLGENSFGRILQGKAAQIVGDPDQVHSFAYVPDVARALVTIGEADESSLGQAWHVPNAPDKSMREVLGMFAKEVEQELKIQTASSFLMTILGLFNPNLRELKELLYQWQTPFRVDHSKFATRFWNDPTPFEEGIAATAKWYRQYFVS